MSKRVCWSVRQLALAMLLTSSSYAIAIPLLSSAAFAQTAPTSPGTDIINVFTGTYDGAPTAGVRSNTVTLKIAEVAGITVTAQTPVTLQKPGGTPSLDPGETATVDFLVCNVGNDATQVFLPDIASAIGASSGAFTVGKPRLVRFSGTAVAPINAADPVQEGIEIAAGLSTSAITPALANGGSLPAARSGETNACQSDNPTSLVVRVPVTPRIGVAGEGDSIKIALGNTTASADPNAAPVGTALNLQNQATGDPPNARSLYTIDNPGTVSGDTTGNPQNGTREAMDNAELIVGATYQAFAKVLLAQTYNNGNTPGVISDDKIDYCLAASVSDVLPEGLSSSILVSDLNPTALNVTPAANPPATDGYVLISDAIPDGLQLSKAAETPTDNNWQAVYTEDAVSIRADKAAWTTTVPADLTKVTRVGFIRQTAVPKGMTTPCFKFQVQPTSTFIGGRIANIAQLFGQSQPGPTLPNKPTQLIYDESGDQTFNNNSDQPRFNPDPTNAGATPANGGITNGLADIALDGRDPGPGTDARNSDTNQGNNGPADPSGGTKLIGGETLVTRLLPSPVNGPESSPTAVGPQTNNDDFTNKVIIPPVNLDPAQPLSDEQTPAVSFVNTVNNPTRDPLTLLLLPTPPSDPKALPDGTKVTLSRPGLESATATYLYNSATGFTFLSGTGGPTATQPLTLVEIPSQGTANYNVTIDLPNALQMREYPVPITAFADQGTPGLDADDPANVTIDRLYTGFIRVIKEARILASDGTEILGFTTDQSQLGAASEANRLIEYRITYENLSQAGTSGNLTLPAQNFELQEDGTTGTNNWFALTDDLKTGSSPAGTATTTLGTLEATIDSGDIKVYTLKVPDLQPGEKGTLTFQRRINE